METGRVIKTFTNVPAPIPVELPKKKDGDTGQTGTEESRPDTVTIPIRKEEEVDA